MLILFICIYFIVIHEVDFSSANFIKADLTNIYKDTHTEIRI